MPTSRHRSGRSQNPRRKVRVGRPAGPAPFTRDKDRHAVALAYLWQKMPIDGAVETSRSAAMRAALCKEGLLVAEQTFSTPPPKEFVAHRHSPISPAFMRGYRDLDFDHALRGRNGKGLLENAAQRIRRKLKGWDRPGRVEREWLCLVAQAWFAALYPHAVRATGANPAETCLAAARAAGEVEFCVQRMLKALARQLDSHENLAICQRLRPPVF